MSEEVIIDIAVEASDVPPAPKKPRTKKVAEEAPEVIVDSSIEEAKSESVNDDVQKVITGPKPVKAPRNSNTRPNKDGIIGSGAADASLNNKKTEDPKKDSKAEKVALWSSSNVRWTGTGTLSKGYNIVNKEAASKWLNRNGIREATPEEVATYYGK